MSDETKFDSDGYLRGTAGSYVLSCVVCGNDHFRERINGQGDPSWCIDCASSGRSSGADGRVVAVHRDHLPLWRVIWKVAENPLKV